MTYLDLADRGKNNWWRYLFGVLVILFMWMGVGGIPFGILLNSVESDQDDSTFFNSDLMKFEGVDPAIGFVVMMLAFIPFLLGIFLVVRFFHKRRFLTLVTSLETIDWKKYCRGLFLMFVIWSFLAMINGLFSPGTYQFVFQWNTFLPFLLLALVLVPIQASTEELLFRGYVMQGIGRLVKARWVVVGLSSVLFMLPHLFNPEAATSPALAVTAYTFVGVFLAVITLKSNSLALAMGAHTGTNLFNIFVGSSSDQVFSKIPTVFIRYEDNAINVETLIVMLLAFVLFYWVCFSRNRVFRSLLSIE